MNTPSQQSTALVPVTPNVSIEHREYTYTPEQIELVKRTVAPGLTNDEFSLFMYVSKARNLDPLQRQIHCVKRKTYVGKDDQGCDQYEERMTIQTGIDGYRAIANRTGLYMPSEKDAKIEGEKANELKVTMYVKKWSHHDQQWHEFSATAYYREFVQTRKTKQGNQWVQEPVAMWQKMPINQLTKCAEALALRKGWPEELGSIRTDEEMQQADSVVIVQEQQPEQKHDKTQREVATLKPSSEPNRGHGNENSQKTAPAQTTLPPEAPAETKKNTSRGAVAVTKVVFKTKTPTTADKKAAHDAGKPEPKTKKYAILTCVAEVDGEEMETPVACWHETLLTKCVPQMQGQACDITVARNDKGFYSLEDVHEIAGTKYMKGEPVVEGGVTNEDVDKMTHGVAAEDAGF